MLREVPPLVAVIDRLLQIASENGREPLSGEQEAELCRLDAELFALCFQAGVPLPDPTPPPAEAKLEPFGNCKLPVRYSRCTTLDVHPIAAGIPLRPSPIPSANWRQAMAGLRTVVLSPQSDDAAFDGGGAYTRQTVSISETVADIQSVSLRTLQQLLHAFADAAAQFPTRLRVVAFRDAARDDGLTAVPASFLPTHDVRQLNIGGTGKMVFGPKANFYGVGGARLTTNNDEVNVGFVIYGPSEDEAVKKFREVGNKAGAAIHAYDLVPGIQSYDSPLVLWVLAVYAILEGSTWLSKLDSIPETPTLHFNPFTASVETLKRLTVACERDEASNVSESVSKPAKKRKRSTQRGEAQLKLISSLTEHHKYANGGCLNLEPIGNNELARKAEVSKSSAKHFFDKEFGGSESEDGHAKYKVVCRDAGRLVDSLKALNGEFSPYELYGRRPPGEQERDENE